MSVLEVKMDIGSEHLDNNANEVWRSGRPNSAGGFDVRISLKNTSNKAIKYVTFVCVPYNAVGDIVASETSGSPVACLKVTGPIEPGKSRIRCTWETVWYNYSIKKGAIQRAEIQYMDGTQVIVPASELGEKKGCYVATAVYGSYDCPEVWTLRRYRDFQLAESWYGRIFIRAYYAISPTLVKLFGETSWFRNMWKSLLDKMVKRLNSDGVSDRPYEDRHW